MCVSEFRTKLGTLKKPLAIVVRGFEVSVGQLYEHSAYPCQRRF